METTSTYENPIENTAGNTYPDQQQPASTPSSKPVLAGILLIIAGLLGLLTWASALAVDTSMLQSVLPANSPITAAQLQSILLICGIIGAIFSIIALAGGFVAMRRKAWGLAIFGSILGIFTIGPLFFISSILAFISLIILIISRKEFQGQIRQ